MLDLKTLKTIDEALDMALDNLLEENAFKKDSPYAQRFLKAKRNVCAEIKKTERVHPTLAKHGRLRD